MATFTMELNEVIESLYNPVSDPDEWDQPYGEFKFNGVVYGKLPTLEDFTALGLGTYPIFDETYRNILNGKIIDEYWNREIGVETIDLFVANLRKKMDQIMPFYNQLYETTLIPYKALDNMNLHSVTKSTIEGEEESKGEGTGKTDTGAGTRAISSNFPQTMLAGNADYATAGNDTNSTSEVNSSSSQEATSNSKSENNSDNLVTGYQGAASDLIMKFRSSLINVDLAILAELDILFMQLFGTGEEFFARNSYGWW